MTPAPRSPESNATQTLLMLAAAFVGSFTIELIILVILLGIALGIGGGLLAELPPDGSLVSEKSQLPNNLDNGGRGSNGQLDPEATKEKCPELMALPKPPDDPQTKLRLMEIFNKEGQRRSISPAFLAGVAMQESGFDRKAVSGAGARGMMQLMPGTFADMQRGDIYLNGRWDNPEVSAYYGAKYYRWLAQEMNITNLNDKANLRRLAAAYNWGIGNYKNAGGDISKATPETQNYVKLIVDNPNSYYNKFAKCLGHDTDSTAATPEGDVFKIYLHWTAGGYSAPSHKYTYNVAGDGEVIQTNGTEHTYARDDNSVGISAMAMAGGSPSCYKNVRGTGCPTGLTQPQLTAMVKLAAKIAKEKKVPIDVHHVLTHGEAGSMKDYPADKVKEATQACGIPRSEKDYSKVKCYTEKGLPHDNYGPYYGGASLRWEYLGYEETLRQMIRAEVAKLP